MSCDIGPFSGAVHTTVFPASRKSVISRVFQIVMFFPIEFM